MLKYFISEIHPRNLWLFDRNRRARASRVALPAPEQRSSFQGRSVYFGAAMGVTATDTACQVRSRLAKTRRKRWSMQRSSNSR